MAQLRLDQVPALVISAILTKQGPEDIATCYRTCKFFQETIKYDIHLSKKLYIYYFGHNQLENVLATKQEKFSIHDEFLKQFQLFGKLSSGDIQIRRLDIKLNFQDYRTRQRKIDQTSQPIEDFFESVIVQQVCLQGYRIGALIQVRQGCLELTYLAIFDTLVGHLTAEPIKIKEGVYQQIPNIPDTMSLAFKQNMAILRCNKRTLEAVKNNSNTHKVGQLLFLKTLIIEQIDSAKGDGQEHATAQQQHDNRSKANSAQKINQPCFIQGAQTYQLQLRSLQNIQIVDLTNSLQEYIEQTVIDGMPPDQQECRQAIKQHFKFLPYQIIDLQGGVLQDDVIETPRDHNIFLLVTFQGQINNYFIGTFMARINLRTGLIEIIHTPLSNQEVHHQLVQYVKYTCNNAEHLLRQLYQHGVMCLIKYKTVIYDRFLIRYYGLLSFGVVGSEVLEYVDLFNLSQSYTININEIEGVIRDFDDYQMDILSFGLYAFSIQYTVTEKNDIKEKKFKGLSIDLKHCFDGASEHGAYGQAFDTNQNIIFQGDRLLAQESKDVALKLNHTLIIPQCKDNHYQRLQYEGHIIYPIISESKHPTSIMMQQTPLRFINYKRITKSQSFLVNRNLDRQNPSELKKVYFGGSHFLYRTLYRYIVRPKLCYEIVQAGQSNGEYSYIMAVDNNPINNNNYYYNSESSTSNKKIIGGKCQHSIEEDKDLKVSKDTNVMSVTKKEQNYNSSGTSFNVKSKNVERDTNSSDVCQIGKHQSVSSNNDNINSQQDDQQASSCQGHSIDTNDNNPIQYVYGDTRYKWTDGPEDNAPHTRCESKGGGIDVYLSSFKLNPLKPYIDDHHNQRHVSYNGQLKVVSEYIEPNSLQIYVSSCNRPQAQNSGDIHQAQKTFQLNSENKSKGIQKDCTLHNTLSFQPYGFVLASCDLHDQIQKFNYDIFIIN